jgi:hypothetical protein
VKTIKNTTDCSVSNRVWCSSRNTIRSFVTIFVWRFVDDSVYQSIHYGVCNPVKSFVGDSVYDFVELKSEELMNEIN